MKHFIFLFLVLVFPIVTNAQARSSERSDSTVIKFLEEQNIRITSNNRITLLKNGHEKFTDLFRSIEKAKHHVHLEYFNFRNDSIAKALFVLLAKKAAQGVEIRAIYDAFGNFSNNKPLKKEQLKTIRNNGIEIKSFDPIKFPFVNHVFNRDHRKIVVIDGKIAYIGGINIADYYIKGLPELGSWRDMHIKIEGNAVEDLQDIFLEIWNNVAEQGIGGACYYHSRDSVCDGIAVAIVDRKPRKLPKLLRETYIKSIASAQKKIQIVNPYFIPPRSVMTELRKALKRGVLVEIMISAKSDIKFTPDGVFHAAHSLMKHGANVYVYNNGFHHSKIMTVDSLFCTVGSANLDNRSLYFDYETNAFVFDKTITDKISRVFENDKLNSTLLTPDEWKKRSKWHRFLGTVANAIRGFL